MTPASVDVITVGRSSDDLYGQQTVGREVVVTFTAGFVTAQMSSIAVAAAQRTARVRRVIAQGA